MTRQLWAVVYLGPSYVVGEPEACRSVAEAVRMFRAYLGGRSPAGEDCPDVSRQATATLYDEDPRRDPAPDPVVTLRVGPRGGVVVERV